jgi:hypothetical protein
MADTPAGNRRTESLAQASLEIGRVLAERDGMTFRAAGTCMYPAVRPGDVLRIRPCAIGDAEVGDIAVCRRPTHLFSHRVVATGRDGGHSYIITRPDRIPEGDDGPTGEKDFLGIVSSVERGGRPVPAGQLKAAASAPRLGTWHALRIKLIEISLRAGLWRNEALDMVQGSALYGLLACTWLSVVRPRISYCVRVPQPALGDAVYRRLDPDEFNPQSDWRGRPVKRWTLALHINGEGEPAAWMAWSREDASSWVEVESFVTGRYRGTGLERKLRRRAGSILRRSAAAGDSGDDAVLQGKDTVRTADGAARNA